MTKNYMNLKNSLTWIAFLHLILALTKHVTITSTEHVAVTLMEDVKNSALELLLLLVQMEYASHNRYQID